MAPKDTTTAFAGLYETLQRYLAIEHGGGIEDRRRAEALLAPDATLVTIGTEPHHYHALPPAVVSSLWNAPAGQFHSISRSDYLNGVEQQTPHLMPECSVHDAIVSIDVTGNAAAAVVHVGNGARTTVFVDHLLLGCGNNEPSWKILSKTFAPQSWPVRQ